jgi:hypothetical protein
MSQSRRRSDEKVGLMGMHEATAERRRRPRGTVATEPTRQNVVSTIIGTFREMPGLCLHLPQAARLFGLPPATCHVILDDLVRRGTLRVSHDGQYVAGELHVAPPPMQLSNFTADERHRARLSRNGR